MFRILEISGGGTKGLIPSYIISEIEENLKTLTGNPNARISDYFDMICGTSAGGILACMYLMPADNAVPKESEHPLMGPHTKFSAKEVFDMYRTMVSSVFVKTWSSVFGFAGPMYDSTYIERILYNYAKDTKISQLRKSCLITAYDLSHDKPHFFTNTPKNGKPILDFYVRDVARATMAAPTYFSPCEAKCLDPSTNITNTYCFADGGLFANNAALCAYAEARNIGSKPKAKDMFILSIECGKKSHPYQYSEVKNQGTLSWIRPLIGIMLNGSSQLVPYQLKSIFEAAGVPDQFVHLNPDLVRASDALDDYSPTNLNNLIQDSFEMTMREAPRIAQLLINLENKKYVDKDSHVSNK
jgi:patatin-like phospholipase/acyl hydrolase